MRHRAGETVDYTVTFLEMTGRPNHPRPRLPTGPAAALIGAETPPAWYFLSLYDAVGASYEWTDQHARSPAEIEAFLHDPKVTLYSLMRAGWPQGFFVLDSRQTGVCTLAYLGVVRQAIGRGLGSFLMWSAVHMAWDRPATERVAVDTCSLDHPRALPLYQKAGFQPVRRETRSRTLTRDRNMIVA